MRRAVLVVMLAVPARADPPPTSWNVTAEAGAEVDTNVDRVETGPGLDAAPISSPVERFGVRADLHGRAAGGAYTLGVSDLTRIVDDDRAKIENVTMLAGDLQWLHRLGDRPLAAGFGLTGADALPLSDPVGAFTFSNLGADAIVQAHSGDDYRATLALGVRKFHYKPDPTFDWLGPVVSARLDFTLWQSAARTKSLELSGTGGFEARMFDANALVNACSPGSPPDPMCYAGTALPRRDRYERAGVELTWVGSLVAALGYQLIVIESNSYGQSLVRHRVTGSVTAEFASFYLTVLGVLQIDRYLDGLILQSDPLHAQFENIEDENRSTLQLRLARKLSATWSLEARAAAWDNLGGGTMDLSFHRDLVYLGVVYSR